ncbi:MAG TPA: aldehyde dehydrogenase family protein [Polyangiaceae bacterium]|nr:aldehyde dehydrogenase family protein [Polyangiaceae bacterium]
MTSTVPSSYSPASAVSAASVAGEVHVLVGEKLLPLPKLEHGDRVVPLAEFGELVVISKAAAEAARAAVARASAALAPLAEVSDAAILKFFEGFAARLEDDRTFAEIQRANALDVESARARQRATGRLELSERMRRDMIAGLRVWQSAPARVGEVIERRQGEGYLIERRRAPLGVIAFVFEGRPNVFADAAGVLRNRNTAVFRIGGDALGTAIAIEEHALRPALLAAGLPEGALGLVRSKEHAAAHALFSERAVRLAVARGSGRTVALLGAIAKQHGIPASLHGTGGAWMLIEASASEELVRNAVRFSLDRKVCNTLNVLVLERAAVAKLGPVVEQALRELGAQVAVVPGSEGIISSERVIAESALGQEWEWDRTPELSFVVADDFAHAVSLINQYSPKFVAAILSERPGAMESFYAAVEAPYVSNGFTRWVDGQWAWHRPELGLTNWETGRLLGRSGFLSGDDLTSVRDVFIDQTGRAPHKR